PVGLAARNPLFAAEIWCSGGNTKSSALGQTELLHTRPGGGSLAIFQDSGAVPGLRRPGAPRSLQCPRRAQSVNSAHVLEARYSASATECRSDSHQWGSRARRRARAQPAHASASAAPSAARTIARAEMCVPPPRALVDVRAPGVSGLPGAGVEAPGAASAERGAVVAPALGADLGAG